jgi:hypothetical protein
MSISTTSIDDLPTGGVEENNNIQIKTTDGLAEPSDMKRLAESELISGIQKAAANGMTMLPSRDIPMDQSAIHEDKQIKANYVPTTLGGDYITKHQTSEEIIRQNAQKQHEKDKWDDIYAELSIPILISALYFMYQLPAVRKLFINYIPFGYGKSGDINLSGRIANCLIFGTIIYMSGKIVTQLSR